MRILILLTILLSCLSSCTEVNLEDCNCDSITIFGYPSCGLLTQLPLTAQDVKEWQHVEVFDSIAIQIIYSELLNLQESNHQFPVDNRFVITLNCSDGKTIDIESNCGHASYGSKYFTPSQNLIEYIKGIAKSPGSNNGHKSKIESKILIEQKQELVNLTYVMKVSETVFDSLFLKSDSTGVYYDSGRGNSYQLKYEIAENEMQVVIYDFEFQYKPSNKVPIAKLMYEYAEDGLMLNSVDYLDDNYNGEIIYLENRLNGRLKSIQTNEN